MGGLAVLAKQMGHQVTGSDAHVYPPMSDQLAQQGIECYQGYGIEPLQQKPNLVVIGNALSRGCEAVEYVLNQHLPYTSGAQYLAEHILCDKKVLAIAGTHGKTTTSSMLAWILEYADLSPSFMIGGVPNDFGLSARLTDSDYFVIEADEYDTAFFDKRSKFVHYHPDVLVINNLEFDHADIFPDLEAIQTQFHHLIRTVPSKGQIISNQQYQSTIQAVLDRGCWSQHQWFMSKDEWTIQSLNNNGQQFEFRYQGEHRGQIDWQLLGQHNQANALAAVIAAEAVGVDVEVACQALNQFKGIKRRQEQRANINGITLYDDFAHHPTAIATTINGLRQKVGQQRIIAVLEPRSNTMKLGIHNQTLLPALSEADQALIYLPSDFKGELTPLNQQQHFFTSMQTLRDYLLKHLQSGDHVLIMSNGSFANIHQQLIEGLQ